MKILNRKKGVYEECTQYGGNLLDILYNHPLGRLLLKIVIHPIFSRINGWYNSTSFSKKKIQPFVKDYDICMDDYEPVQYKSFNDFFTRKIKKNKRPIDFMSESLVSVADSKLMLYPIHKNNMIRVKGVKYTLSELVGNKVSLKSFDGGLCMVFRLTMDDYHRYIYMDNGKMLRQYKIKGRLHTVSSISKSHKIYRENTRVVNLMETQNFGKVICIEVGALLVGKIINHPITDFARGMEKGYFELGGSTIIMLFQKDCVKVDEDIVRACAKGMEVKVLMGERIGKGSETC